MPTKVKITNLGVLERVDYRGLRRTILDELQKHGETNFPVLIANIRHNYIEFKHLKLKDFATATAELINAGLISKR